MEPTFRRFLATCGITDTTQVVLEEESVFNMSVFLSLREEHFERLLPKLKVGQHATLMKAWETRLACTSCEVCYL